MNVLSVSADVRAQASRDRQLDGEPGHDGEGRGLAGGRHDVSGGGGAWQENTLPVSAARVFSPAPAWEAEPEKTPFLHQHFLEEEWPEEALPTGTLPRQKHGHCCSERVLLKMAVSLGTAALLFPFLIWGGYLFLPFDAPVMDDAPLRLVYTLRCSVFATLPISMLCVTPGVWLWRTEVGGPREVAVHRAFVTDSAHLFLLYFLQLVVMATYLSQEQLKLVPLLTVLFCLGRLVYWVAAAFQSSIRAFGFGLSFLPSLVMMVANLYFMVTMEMSGGLTNPPYTEQAPPSGRQRFWG
uniref:Transmembrane protein 79b n=1 Tax=Neogobius melanostomus TaxID=47308 RepID=A0A8C6WHU1_9GOBI